MARSKQRACFVILALPVFWLMPSRHAIADTFAVTKTLDTNDGSCDDDCSLREAVIGANQHPGADTIIVPAGTYVLTLVGRDEDQGATGDLDILDDLTISGAGADNTWIDGNGTDRIFDVPGGVALVLSGLGIENGNAFGTEYGNVAGDGGGIANAGTLTLTDCTLVGNFAFDAGGGIFNSGAATLTNCGLGGNKAGPLYEYRIGDGGGIDNTHSGTLTMTNCHLGGHEGGWGGGIANLGTATLINCSISGGQLTLSGGGIANAGTMILIDCNVSYNTAVVYGGGILNGGTLTLTNSTVNGNRLCKLSGPGCYDDDIFNNGTLILHVAPTDLARLMISNNGNPPGDERFKARGRVQLVTMTPVIDPIAHGFTITIADPSGAVVFTRSVPPGQAPDPRSPGWRVNAGRTRWTFRDATGTRADGITRVAVSTQPNVAPGRYRFTIRGRGAFQVLPAQAPVQLVAIFGAEEQRVAGQCGQCLFNPDTALALRCTFSRGGDLLSCR